MSAEKIPTGYNDDDEFDRPFAEVAEESVLQRINAMYIFKGLASQGIPVEVYYSRLGATPLSENIFDALIQSIPDDIQLTGDKPKVAEEKISWMRRLADTLPTTMIEKEKIDTEEAELYPGRIRVPYESKLAMQIDIAKEKVLNADWRSALIEVVDQLTPGISLTDFTKEEQRQILADGDLRNVQEGEVRVYEKYARNALQEVLEDYAGHEAFAPAIDELALVLVGDYLSTDVRTQDVMVFASYHLSSMGLSSETQIVQDALHKARIVLEGL